MLRTELIDLINGGDAWAFIGSGVSADAGGPTWDQLLEAVWGEQRYVTPRTVDVHVRRLREQIEEQPDAPRYLTTVRGFGYRFEEVP